MVQYLRGSLLALGFAKLVSIYKTSLLNKAGATLGIWYTNSTFHNVLKRYMAREPSDEHTVSYRTLRFFGSKIDLAVGKIHGMYAAGLETSHTYNLYMAFRSQLAIKPGLLISIFSIAFAAGLALASFVRGAWSTTRVIFILLFFAGGIASAATAGKLGLWARNSSIYRLCKYIWE